MYVSQKKVKTFGALAILGSIMVPLSAWSAQASFSGTECQVSPISGTGWEYKWNLGGGIAVGAGKPGIVVNCPIALNLTQNVSVSAKVSVYSAVSNNTTVCTITAFNNDTKATTTGAVGYSGTNTGWRDIFPGAVTAGPKTSLMLYCGIPAGSSTASSYLSGYIVTY